ncbi:MAG TPA: DUF4389 domain-containing protein [Dehalococcoidia bacterium]|nr:DUF4389 domain-containing protein [Dehalococcoidia bacterium]
MTLQEVSYPVQFDVVYPDEPLNRLSTFLRILFLIPIVIVLATVAGGQLGGGAGLYVSVGGLLVLPILLMILFRRKYPRWWFDWNLEILRFASRVGAYSSLLRDEYPSTDDEQSVHLNIAYPDVTAELNRWLPLFKWILAIPHYIVLFFLGIAAFIVIIIAWFAILFTGRYPRHSFNFVVGVMRWSIRVEDYAFLMVTDEYPPFHLSQ